MIDELVAAKRGEREILGHDGVLGEITRLWGPVALRTAQIRRRNQAFRDGYGFAFATTTGGRSGLTLVSANAPGRPPHAFTGPRSLREPAKNRHARDALSRRSDRADRV